MRKNKLINKKETKLGAKKCYFCEEDNYCSLDVHRIKEGQHGGRYTQDNTIVCCVNCHRKIHDGKIQIFRKYLSTKGQVLHYFNESGEERFDPI